MNAFLYRLLELNIQASLLIAGILLLRWLARGRISPRLQYGLWGLVALRLLIPASIRSRFSLLNAVRLTSGSLRSPAPAPSALMQPLPGEPVSMVTPEEIVNLPDTLPQTQQIIPGQLEPELDAAASQAGWATDVVVLLAIGVLVFLVYAIVVNHTFYQRYVKPATRMELACALPVYSSPRAASPCLFGIFHPVILLNSRATEHPRKQSLAVSHELAHYYRRDHWAAALRAVLCAVYWYNPLVWLAAKISRQDCELACDAAVMRGFSQDQCEEYGMALLSMIPSGHTSGLACATSMTGSKRTLKQRIAFIGKRPRTAAAAALLVAASMLALCLVACTGALKKIPSSSEMSVQIIESGHVLPVQEAPQIDNNDADALEAVFAAYLQDMPYADIPLISLMDTVQITDYISPKLNKDYADVFLEIRDYIVDESGRIKFRAGEDHLGMNRSVAVHVDSAEESRYTFQLEPNMAALFSSFSGDYDPGATLRGFLVTLRYREPEKTEDTIRGYAFMLRSDAHAFTGAPEDGIADASSGADETAPVPIGGEFPYDLVLYPGQFFSSVDMDAVYHRMRMDTYDQALLDARIASGRKIKIYAYAPFESGTLVVAGFPTEGEFIPDLFYVEEGKVKNRTYGAGYWAYNYARFMGHTIVFGPSFAWKEGVPLETTHAVATFFDGQQVECDMHSTPERSAGYLLVVPGNAWLKTLRLYNGDALVASENRSDQSLMVLDGKVSYLSTDSALHIRNDTNLCSMYTFAAMQSSQYDPESAKCYLEAKSGKLPLQFWPKNDGLLLPDIWRSANNAGEMVILSFLESPALLHGLDPEEILDAQWVDIIKDTGQDAHSLREFASDTQALGEDMAVSLPQEPQNIFMLVIETQDGYYTARMLFNK